ncbi:hypothetical protein DE146DRAFT_11795 [Phaeosphaeria sp. MPI-PUGE-AT-0046c]|nr:hypothetical protein DE146DRAFT_11795 [Phaeosphaeria sp. MPI-PUGE-AT-0046c]
MAEEQGMVAKYFGDAHRGCGQSFVKNLAAAVHHRLPREIRNYVYSYCVQSDYDDDVIVRRRADPYGAMVLLVRDSLGPYSYRWIEDPITSFIKASILGNEVAREMLEIYYRVRKFKIAHRDLPLVEAFLKTDTFHLDISPALYVRRLEIDIEVEAGEVQHQEAAGSPEEDVGLQAIQALSANIRGCTDVAVAFCHDDQSPCHSARGRDRVAFDDVVSPRLLQAVESLRNERPRARIVYRRTWRD